MDIIARVRSDFPDKFGIPRQSGLAPQLKAQIVFAPPFRNPDALRGLEQFSHIWLIWQFSQALRDTWSPTVRPPRLGGNQRIGVFASRSPFRPNSLGLSSVKLEKIELEGPQGPVLHIAGADLADGTPIFDIKPYLPYVDSHPEAVGGFTEETKDYRLQVEIPPCWMEQIPPEHRQALQEVLALDPRPAYQKDPGRVYGFGFAGLEVQFQVEEQVLRVCRISRTPG